MVEKKGGKKKDSFASKVFL